MNEPLHSRVIIVCLPLDQRLSAASFPGDLPDSGIKLRSPALQADALLSEPPGKCIHNGRARVAETFKSIQSHLSILGRGPKHDSWSLSQVTGLCRTSGRDTYQKHGLRGRGLPHVHSANVRVPAWASFFSQLVPSCAFQDRLQVLPSPASHGCSGHSPVNSFGPLSLLSLPAAPCVCLLGSPKHLSLLASGWAPPPASPGPP